jgi:hypothetical protein
MGPFDLAVRRHVYGVIVATGRAPAAGEAARALGRGTAEVEASYRRLDEAHAFVLAPGDLDREPVLLRTHPASRHGGRP